MALLKAGKKSYNHSAVAIPAMEETVTVPPPDEPEPIPVEWLKTDPSPIGNRTKYTKVPGQDEFLVLTQGLYGMNDLPKGVTLPDEWREYISGKAIEASNALYKYETEINLMIHEYVIALKSQKEIIDSLKKQLAEYQTKDQTIKGYLLRVLGGSIDTNALEIQLLTLKADFDRVCDHIGWSRLQYGGDLFADVDMIKQKVKQIEGLNMYPPSQLQHHVENLNTRVAAIESELLANTTTIPEPSQDDPGDW